MADRGVSLGQMVAELSPLSAGLDELLSASGRTPWALEALDGGCGASCGASCGVSGNVLAPARKNLMKRGLGRGTGLEIGHQWPWSVVERREPLI